MLPKSSRSVQKVMQDKGPPPLEQEQLDRSFDLESIKYLRFDNIKSVKSTKLESSTSQKRLHITQKKDCRSDGTFMSFKIFRIIFHEGRIEAFHATKTIQ